MEPEGRSVLPGGLARLPVEVIARRIAQHPPEMAIPPAAVLRPAAVLVPLVWQADGWHLLYTRRGESLQSHKGQVAFPGGAADPGDAGPEATALRETHEEIGLLPEHVQVLGRLGRRPTISQYIVTPVVAQVQWPYAFRLSQLEVSRVFTIPLAWLADPAHREERPVSAPGSYYERVIYYEPFDSEILWGASARITVDFLEALQQ